MRMRVRLVTKAALAVLEMPAKRQIPSLSNVKNVRGAERLEEGLWPPRRALHFAPRGTCGAVSPAEAQTLEREWAL